MGMESSECESFNGGEQHAFIPQIWKKAINLGDKIVGWGRRSVELDFSPGED